MAQDYWRGGWANQTDMLPGTRAAAMDKGRYGPWNALADIIGAVWKRNDARAKANAMKDFYSPVNVNTSDVVSTPQYGDMSLQSAIGNREHAQTPAEQAITEAAPLGGARSAAGNMADSMQDIGMTGAANAMRNFQGAAPAPFGTGAWYQQNVQPQQQAQAAQPQTPQQVATQQSGEAPGQYTPPTPQQSQGDALEVGFSNHDGVTMDNGRVGCAEAVGKIGSYFSPFYKAMADQKVYWVPTMLQEAQNAGYQIERFNPETVQRGDGIVYGDGDHIMIADGNGGAYGNSSNARGADGDGAVVHGGNLADYGQPTLVIKTSQDLQGMQGQGQPAQRGEAIQLPQTQRYRPEQRQLHQATAEQPWVDRYNSKERVLSAFDDAWAKKMDALAKAYPEMLNDRSFMQQAIAMREQARNQLLDEWQGTQTKRNWDEFQTALADNDYNKALFFGYKNGLDPNAMKALMSQDWTSQLVNFGGEQRVVSQNKYTGEILVNGQPATAESLAETLTPAQSAQIARDDRNFAYRQHRDAVEDAYKERALTERTSAGRGSSSDRSAGVSSQDVKNAEYVIRQHEKWVRANPDADEKESPYYDIYGEAQEILDEAHGIERTNTDSAESVDPAQAVSQAQSKIDSGTSFDDVAASIREDYDSEDAEYIISQLKPRKPRLGDLMTKDGVKNIPYQSQIAAGGFPWK